MIKKDFDVVFTSLKNGIHYFNYKIGNSFFGEYKYDIRGKVEIEVEVRLEKLTTLMTFEFALKGNSITDCDRCGGDVKVEFEGDYKLYVNFGEDYSDTSEDVYTIPHNEYKINLSDFIYEYIVLSLPSKFTHSEGLCDKETIKYLSHQEDIEEDETSIDPRWEGLKDIMNNKN